MSTGFDISIHAQGAEGIRIVRGDRFTWITFFNEDGKGILTIHEPQTNAAAFYRRMRDVLTEHLRATDPDGETASLRERLEGFVDEEIVATIFGGGQSAELAPGDPVDIDALIADGAEFVADDGAGPEVEPEANANMAHHPVHDIENGRILTGRHIAADHRE